MTTDTVTAADLAAALREAVSHENGRCMTLLGRRSVARWKSDRDILDIEISRSKEKTDRWQAVLDRWDAQRREAIEDLCMGISDDIHDREWSMQAARKCRLLGGEVRTITRLAKQARAANHRILALRRELRAMGGDA